LHKWMKQHTDNGNITRQEAVSMVPPLALDVQPHHFCLDMCAAPGSKTSQLLEIVNRSLQYGDDQRQGLVVANDSDTDRAYMLVHQCRRINSPLLIVTTHKGQLFPSLLSTEGTDQQARSASHFLFDRVLCDVPCSGDGTLRKNPAIWSKWNTSSSMTLHPLQLIIAQRGLQLLKEDGLMVYSTCSMSPYEDEAVVAELLRSSGGSLELVDARQFLPLFTARSGLASWHVLDDFLAARQQQKVKERQKKDAKMQQKRQQYAAEHGAESDAEEPSEPQDPAEKEEPSPQASSSSSEPLPPLLQACVDMGIAHYPAFESVPEHLRRKVRRSLFPPTAEEAQWMHLERCLRCVPQDEDTGGFFVATLRKKVRVRSDASATSLPETQENEAKEDATGEAAQDEADAAAVQEESGPRPAQKSLVDFLPWDRDEFQRIQTFYGLAEGTLTSDSFFIREDHSSPQGREKASGGNSKAVYLLPFASRRLLGPNGAGHRLKVVTAGIKVFERKYLQGGGHDYRLLQVLPCPAMCEK